MGVHYGIILCVCVCVCVYVCVCLFVCLCATIDYETYGRQIDAIILTIADRQIRLFIQVDTTKSMKEKYVGLVEIEIKYGVFYTTQENSVYTDDPYHSGSKTAEKSHEM